MRFICAFICLCCTLNTSICQSDTFNILVIGAHPDDADLCAGGTAILWAQMGHRVKFLSLTNGNAGHQTMEADELAKRRKAESQEVARRLGIAEYEVLDNPDGKLEPSYEVRLQVIRRIRNWKADIVILPRPNDYHPDHRNTGLVVQDAAYMVIVPSIAKDTPPLIKNPVFLYCQDRFQKPNPFEADIAIDISDVFEKKIKGLDAHESQFYEWLPWTMQASDKVPKSRKDKINWLKTWRSRKLTPTIKSSLSEWYGEYHTSKVTQAEAFEISEYGTQPSDKDIEKLFPMLAKPPSLQISKTSGKIKVDGKLTEKIYDKLPKHYLKNSLTGRDVVNQDYKTYFHIHHDGSKIYIAFRSNDLDIYNTYENRDDHLWKQECVEVFINTNDDPSDYVEIQVSPENVFFDSYIVDPKKIDLIETPKFDLGSVEHAVYVSGTTRNRNDTDSYWTAEIAIDISELDKDFNESNDSWDINFYRINRDKADEYLLSFSPTYGGFHKPFKFVNLMFE